MVEGARLEIVCALSRTESSNLSLSAIFNFYAEVAELADAADSKSAVGNNVPVQVRLPAPLVLSRPRDVFAGSFLLLFFCLYECLPLEATSIPLVNSSSRP